MNEPLNELPNGLPNEPLDESPINYRSRLLRDGVVLQVKLVVDGIRDAVLIPLALVAVVLGLTRGGADADREFRRVIKLGRRSERWINLFGHEVPSRRAGPGGSLDQLLERVEAEVVQQYSKGKSLDEARAAIKAAMDAAPGNGSKPDQ
jgi:hypothetical protein